MEEISELDIDMKLIKKKETIIIRHDSVQINSHFLQSVVTMEDILKAFMNADFIKKDQFPKFTFDMNSKPLFFD
jgi:hypothetical protein